MSIERDEPNQFGQTSAVDPAIDYFDGLPEKKAEPATLQLLARLANESKDLEAAIHTKTVDLAEDQAKLDGLLRKRIPEIMKDLGMEEFKLTDGSKVSVKADIKCSITEANKPTAFAWLEETSNDGIIKTKVGVDFGKGEMEEAKKAVELLQGAGLDASVDRAVHPSTLKSFVKEMLEKGVNIPIDAFGIFEFTVAKITLPKVAKPK